MNLKKLLSLVVGLCLFELWFPGWEFNEKSSSQDWLQEKAWLVLILSLGSLWGLSCDHNMLS